MNEQGERWSLVNGDCVEVLRTMPEASIHLTVTSIPFASLFVYSNSDRDFGNCQSHDEFFEHFSFWVREMLRVTKLGRLACIHLMNLPTSKTRDGRIGLRDFRGRVIASMEEGGWIYHSECCIWKDPVTAMQRTKAIGLLYKQLRKDSTMSRMGIPDYLCMFRKPGENDEPVSHTDPDARGHYGGADPFIPPPSDFPVSLWQEWASPIWMNINQGGDTLNARIAREEPDEAHLAPLQLEVIKRALILYSNPGDVILDPFAGIGSTGYVAMQHDRRFIGIELKESYFKQAVTNLRSIESQNDRQISLF